MDSGFLPSLLAGLATGAGALPLFFLREQRREGSGAERGEFAPLAAMRVGASGHALYDLLLGLAAGIMLAASFISLLLPAVDRGGPTAALAGLAVGAALILLLELALPHGDHFSPEPLARDRRRGLLLAAAVTLHNLPEGFAVGVGYAAGSGQLGSPLALAIALQNAPEGFAVAVPLAVAGLSPWRGFLWATASGLVEPLAALAGGPLGAFGATALPVGLAAAAGAMVFVVCHHLIPESHGHGHSRGATLALLAGVAVTLGLQQGFGR